MATAWCDAAPPSAASPVREGSPAADGADLDILSTTPQPSHVGTVRVLVVEDDPLQQTALAGLFEGANRKIDGMVRYEVVFADNGAQTLQILSEQTFSLILLDLLLPDIQGQELIPTIREIVGIDVAIVIATAYSHISLVQVCVRRGADIFMVKPLGSDEVLHIWQCTQHPLPAFQPQGPARLTSLPHIAASIRPCASRVCAHACSCQRAARRVLQEPRGRKSELDKVQEGRRQLLWRSRG